MNSFFNLITPHLNLLKISDLGYYFYKFGQCTINLFILL